MSVWLYLLIVVGFLLFLAVGFALGYFSGFNMGLLANVRQNWINHTLEIIRKDRADKPEEGKVN